MNKVSWAQWLGFVFGMFYGYLIFVAKTSPIESFFIVVTGTVVVRLLVEVLGYD